VRIVHRARSLMYRKSGIFPSAIQEMAEAALLYVKRGTIAGALQSPMQSQYK